MLPYDYWETEAPLDLVFRSQQRKDYLLVDLRQRYPCHMYAYGETFQTMHTGTQFVLLTNTQKPISKLLNSIKCVMELAYPVKQSSATTLDEPVVIVCSNKPPEDVYPNFYFLVLACFRVFEL